MLLYYTFSLSVLATFFSCFPDSCSGPPLMNVTTWDKVKKENVTVEQPGPLKITLWEGIILLVMYFGYVFFMAHNQAVRIWVVRVVHGLALSTPQWCRTPGTTVVVVDARCIRNIVLFQLLVKARFRPCVELIIDRVVRHAHFVVLSQ